MVLVIQQLLSFLIAPGMIAVGKKQKETKPEIKKVKPKAIAYTFKSNKWGNACMTRPL